MERTEERRDDVGDTGRVSLLSFDGEVGGKEGEEENVPGSEVVSVCWREKGESWIDRRRFGWCRLGPWPAAETLDLTREEGW